MKIKKFKEFESISGLELVGQHVMGPNYGEQKLAVTLASSDTETLMGMDENFYTYDDYQELYNNYQKGGGKENIKEFTKLNLDKVIKYLNFIQNQNVD